MEKDKLNNTQIQPTPASPIQSNNSNNDWQENSPNNQPLGANTQLANTIGTQNGSNMSTTTTSSSTPNNSSHSTKKSNKNKKIVVLFTTLAAIAIATIVTLFLTGIIGEHRVEVGDYTVVINEDNWTSSIGQDGNTLVLMNKENNLSGIGILPYTKDVTYDLLDQEDQMKSFINQINNIQFESQSRQTISDTRCIVVNVKYKKVTYVNDKAIKAFCEGKDGAIFLIEVEGADQAELNSNLSAGVDIINTAKHN